MSAYHAPRAATNNRGIFTSSDMIMWRAYAIAGEERKSEEKLNKRIEKNTSGLQASKQAMLVERASYASLHARVYIERKDVGLAR